MTSYWLNLHAAYRCRDSGACCGAGWPVPVEVSRAGAIGAAVRAGALIAMDGAPGWLEPHSEAPDGVAGTFRLTAKCACVFHRGSASGCAVHRALGHEALPGTCQHFPRVCLIDARGIHVTLSHFCPTAAALLFAHEGPVHIVEGPAPVPGREAPEGLDVREAVPPLLTERVLMDLDAHAAWERHAVAVLAGPAAGGEAEAAAARLIADAGRLARWRPGQDAALVEAVARLADDVAPGDPAPLRDRLARLRRVDRVRAACPGGWAWPEAPEDLAAADARYVAPEWGGWAAVVRRYLAAKAFASWAPWQGRGPRAAAGAVALALDVLRVEAGRQAATAGRPLDRTLLTAAIREADRLLLHHADRQALADLATTAFANARRAG